MFVALCALLALAGLLWLNQRTVRRHVALADVAALDDEAPLRLYSYDELDHATYSFRAAFGTVFKGTLRHGGERAVAVKWLEKLVEDGEWEFQREVRAIVRKSHCNLVRLLSCCHEGANRLLIYEYMSNGSLANFLIYDYMSNAVREGEKKGARGHGSSPMLRVPILEVGEDRDGILAEGAGGEEWVGGEVVDGEAEADVEVEPLLEHLEGGGELDGLELAGGVGDADGLEEVEREHAGDELLLPPLDHAPHHRRHLVLQRRHGRLCARRGERRLLLFAGLPPCFQTTAAVAKLPSSSPVLPRWPPHQPPAGLP